MLVYGQGKTGQCFSSGFLHTLARKTRIEIKRDFTPVDLGSQNLYRYPFAVLTGQGAFTLTKEQRTNLHAYVNRGGLLLASSGCSNAPWRESFLKQIKQVLPKAAIKPLKMDHAIFRSAFEIDRMIAKSPTEKVVLYGIELNGRLVVVFSPLGLNDTANAGGGCCCCGGNEIRDAHLINANILAYALTR